MFCDLKLVLLYTSVCYNKGHDYDDDNDNDDDDDDDDDDDNAGT